MKSQDPAPKQDGGRTDKLATSSYRYENLGPKHFRILAVPSITATEIVNPLQPSPEFPKRRMEPTVDSIRISRESRPPLWKRDPPWRGSSSILAPVRFNPTAIQDAIALIAQFGQRKIEDRLLAKAEARRDKILRSHTPRAPRESDPVGFVPRELRFTPYLFNLKPPIRTESQWRREFLINSDGTVGTPRLTLTDLSSGVICNSFDAVASEELNDVLERMLKGEDFGEFEVEDAQPQRQPRVYIKPRDRQLLAIVRRMTRGLTQKEIASQLKLSPRTIQNRIAEIARRTNHRTLNESVT